MFGKAIVLFYRSVMSSFFFIYIQQEIAQGQNKIIATKQDTLLAAPSK